MTYNIKHHVYIDSTEVCGRVDRCSYMEMAMDMAVKMKTGQRGVQGGAGGRRWRRDSPLRRRPSWGVPPLSLLPPWILGDVGRPPPWRLDPWGRQKRGFGGWNSWVLGVLHDLGFLPLYSFSDFRHPF